MSQDMNLSPNNGDIKPAEKKVDIKQFACPHCGEVAFSQRDKAKMISVSSEDNISICPYCGNLVKMSNKQNPWGFRLFLIALNLPYWILSYIYLYLDKSDIVIYGAFNIKLIIIVAMGWFLSALTIIIPWFKYLYCLWLGKSANLYQLDENRLKSQWQKKIYAKDFLCPWCYKKVFSLKDKKDTITDDYAMTVYKKCPTCNKFSKINIDSFVFLHRPIYCCIFALIVICFLTLDIVDIIANQANLLIYIFIIIILTLLFMELIVEWIFVFITNKFTRFIKADDPYK